MSNGESVNLRDFPSSKRQKLEEYEGIAKKNEKDEPYREWEEVSVIVKHEVECVVKQEEDENKISDHETVTTGDFSAYSSFTKRIKLAEDCEIKEEEEDTPTWNKNNTIPEIGKESLGEGEYIMPSSSRISNRIFNGDIMSEVDMLIAPDAEEILSLEKGDDAKSEKRCDTASKEIWENGRANAMTNQDDTPEGTQAQYVIILLRLLPFSQRSEEERKKIILEGRPGPIIQPPISPRFHQSIIFANQNEVQCSQKFYRNTCYEKHKWLCGCTVTKNLYCWPCLLFAPAEDSSPLINTTDTNDYKNVFLILKNHETTKTHMLAERKLVKLKWQFSEREEIEMDELQNETQEKRMFVYRSLVKIILSAAFELCKKTMDSRGSHKPATEADFRAAVENGLRKNVELSKYWNSRITGLSKETMEILQMDALECLGDEIRNLITDALEKSPFFVCMIEKTIDILGKSRYLVIVRYLDSNCGVHEDFLRLCEASGSDDFCQVLKQAFGEQLMKDKLIGYSFSGIGVNGEYLKYLEEQVRPLAPNAHLLPNRNPNLNIVLQRICSSSDPARMFFSILQGIPAFFHQSAKLQQKFLTITGQRTCSESKWSASSKIVTAIYNCRLELINVLGQLMDSPEASIVRASHRYWSHLKSGTFIFFLSLFSKVFEKTDELQSLLIETPCDVKSCIGSTKQCIHFITGLMVDEMCTTFILEAVEASGEEETSGIPCQKISLDEYENYKLIYYKILNNVSKHLEATLHILNQWESHSLSYTKKNLFTVATIKRLSEVYGSYEYFNREKLTAELLKFSCCEDSVGFERRCAESRMKQMRRDGTSDILTEMFKLFQFSSLITLSYSNNDKNWSWLTRCRNGLESCQIKVSNDIALITIEKSVLEKLESYSAWHDSLVDRFAARNLELQNQLFSIKSEATLSAS